MILHLLDVFQKAQRTKLGKNIYDWGGSVETPKIEACVLLELFPAQYLSCFAAKLVLYQTFVLFWQNSFCVLFENINVWQNSFCVLFENINLFTSECLTEASGICQGIKTCLRGWGWWWWWWWWWLWWLVLLIVILLVKTMIVNHNLWWWGCWCKILWSIFYKSKSVKLTLGKC